MREEHLADVVTLTVPIHLADEKFCDIVTFSKVNCEVAITVDGIHLCPLVNEVPENKKHHIVITNNII